MRYQIADHYPSLIQFPSGIPFDPIKCPKTHLILVKPRDLYETDTQDYSLHRGQINLFERPHENQQLYQKSDTD